MKTLVITDAPIPDRLRDFITRGSTAVDERRVADEASSRGMPDADRIVFWSTGADTGMRQLAARYAKEEKAERKEAIVFVTTSPDNPVIGLSNTECFLWPQDEDRLRMAFLTGA
jgi:hypothetical protein